MSRTSAGRLQLKRLEFQDNSSLSSIELSPSPQRTPAHCSEVCPLPPADHPLTPQSCSGQVANSPNLLQVPKLFVTKYGSTTCPLDENNDAVHPSCNILEWNETFSVPDDEGERPSPILSALHKPLSKVFVTKHSSVTCPLDNAVHPSCSILEWNETFSVPSDEEERPSSILSALHKPLSRLSKSLSSLSLSSAQQSPHPSPYLDSNNSRRNSEFSFSSNLKVKSISKGLLSRGGAKQENHAQDDVVSEMSGEELTNLEESRMSSRAIKKKLDSLAGSMYGLGDDIEGGDGERNGGKKHSLRWWLKKLGCTCIVRRKRVCKYHIDPHG